MKKFQFQKINFVCRIVENDKKFKFDVLFKNDLIITDGKEYEEFENCAVSLAEYLTKLANQEINAHVIATDFINEENNSLS